MSKHTHATPPDEAVQPRDESAATPVQPGSASAADQAGEASEFANEGATDANLAAKDAELAAYRKKLAEVEGELSSVKEQYLRKAAEFENYRKRMVREKQDAIDFANQSLLLDLIPVIDDFERAIKSADDAKNFESFHEGIVLIEKRLVSQLESKWQLVRFESTGKPFDPNLHEAIMMEKRSDIGEPLVTEDFFKGYTLKDRVVRSAKVRVAMPEEAREDLSANPPASAGTEGNAGNAEPGNGA